MARHPKSTILVGDFETTVYEGQESTEVWASALVELNTEDVEIFHSIQDTFAYLLTLSTRRVVVYYHNLKFDGSFWLSYFITELKLHQAFIKTVTGDIVRLKEQDMPDNSFNYVISSMGQWYLITVKIGDKIIEFRDSLKLLPFSVRKIGKDFETKHRKLDMEYEGYRYAGCEITDEEKKYIANDVLVIKEALEFMFESGHRKLTIGACCLSEYKQLFKWDFGDWDAFFPDVYQIPLDPSYGSENVGLYIRKSYKGGWCYVVKGKAGKQFKKGCTADVNSLYPSVMSSESGCVYPYGEPHFWKGAIPQEAIGKNKYYFVRFKCRFYIKEGMLPFVQIKSSFLYKATEALETSDVYDKKTNKYYKFLRDIEGNIIPTTVELTMTCTDWALFNEHYNIEELEILDGCWFYAGTGLFDGYINKYKKIKQESTGAKRALAKLFLNNLYGKFASSTISSFKYATSDDDDILEYDIITEDNKKPVFIPVGSAVTSYARNFTIRTAQKNYHGVDKPGFIYADTDSIHCDLDPSELIDVPVHPTEFCHWKIESCWDVGIFARQKTYIEHVTHEDMKKVEQPYYNIKCAGMPDRCKELLNMSILGLKPKNGEKYYDDELEFIGVKRTLKDFKVGLCVPSKLLPKRIKGGTILVRTTYEMR